MKNKKVINNIDEMMKISKNLDNNRLEKILNYIIDINSIKNTKATKKSSQGTMTVLRSKEPIFDMTYT